MAFSPPGFVLCVSGPSGSGKTSLCDRLCREFDFAVRSISVTTRGQRATEVDGKDYHFVSAKEFQEKQKAGEFLETAEVFGNCYGTLKKPVMEAIDLGQIIVMDIDTVGARSIKKEMGDRSRTVFILPPSLDELKRRLEARKQNNPEDLARRLAEAQREMAESDVYDFKFVNSDLELAYGELRSYLLRCRQATESS